MVAREVSRETEKEAAFALRVRVFCDEQNVDREDEFDGLDADARHVVAYDGDEVIGTCRVLVSGNEGRIGRMAVDSASRRSGVGSELLRVAEEIARTMGVKRIVLHAQTAAEGFYARGGYSAYGGRFISAGIEHIAMEKAVA